MLLPIEHRNRSKAASQAPEGALKEVLTQWLEAGLRKAGLRPEYKGGAFIVTYRTFKRRGKPRLTATARVTLFSNGKVLVKGISSDFAPVQSGLWLELDLKDMWSEREGDVGDRIGEAIGIGAGVPR